MAKEKWKNLSNGNQGNLAISEPSFPTTASSGLPNTPEKEDSDLKSYLTMMMEIFEKHMNNSFKQLQENTHKQIVALKEETQKSLKELKENATNVRRN